MDSWVEVESSTMRKGECALGPEIPRLRSLMWHKWASPKGHGLVIGFEPIAPSRLGDGNRVERLCEVRHEWVGLCREASS